MICLVHNRYSKMLLLFAVSRLLYTVSNIYASHKPFSIQECTFLPWLYSKFSSSVSSSLKLSLNTLYPSPISLFHTLFQIRALVVFEHPFVIHYRGWSKGRFTIVSMRKSLLLYYYLLINIWFSIRTIFDPSCMLSSNCWFTQSSFWGSELLIGAGLCHMHLFSL